MEENEAANCRFKKQGRIRLGSGGCGFSTKGEKGTKIRSSRKPYSC